MAELAPVGKLSEGKTKIVWSTNRDNVLLLEFKDSITALDGRRRDLIAGKAAWNAEVSARLFEELNKVGIPTHFLALKKPKTLVVRKLDMIQLEVVCRNYAAGSLAKRFPILKFGSELPNPIVELYFKSDELHDPMVTEDLAVALGIADREALSRIRELTLKANDVLSKFFGERGLKLVDFKLEFGFDEDGELRIGDELGGDVMRIWDAETGESLDKDVYRKGESLEDVRATYEKLWRRVVAQGRTRSRS